MLEKCRISHFLIDVEHSRTCQSKCEYYEANNLFNSFTSPVVVSIINQGYWGMGWTTEFDTSLFFFHNEFTVLCDESHRYINTVPLLNFV